MFIKSAVDDAMTLVEICARFMHTRHHINVLNLLQGHGIKMQHRKLFQRAGEYPESLPTLCKTIRNYKAGWL